MLKIWGKPLWNVRCQHHIQRHHCHLCLCTNNFNNYLQRGGGPIFYQKVTQQISNFTAVVFLGRKALPALLLLDCEDVGKYHSTKDNIWMSFWLPKIVRANSAVDRFEKTWGKKRPHDFSRWVRRVFWKLATPTTTTAGVKWVAVQMNDRRYLLALTL